MLHLCLPSSRSPLRKCSRFYHPSIGLDFRRVTAVQDSKVNEKLWHIARVLHNSSKACWAIHVVTKNKCTAKIVSNSKSTFVPTYLGVWNYYKFTTPKVEKFCFALTTLNVVSKVHVASGSTNSLLTKNDLQSRPYGMSNLVPTSLVRSSWSFKMLVSSSRGKNPSRSFACSTVSLLPWTSSE